MQRPTFAVLLLLTACSTEPAVRAVDQAVADSAAPAERVANASAPGEMANPDAWARDRYLGRWTGVEGMYLDVAAAPRDGGVTLDMQWGLDHKGRFGGSVTAEGIRFMRNGEPEIAAPSDGAATGLKYLAGKKNCLTVKPGEGYCRD